VIYSDEQIKIDRRFVVGVCADKRAEAIVRSIVDLARDLHLRVVAEGIETRDVLERLAALGCDIGQGYLISRPAPAAELTAWLASSGFDASQQSRAPKRSGASPLARSCR
jgi:EAL domain-containing protein (putative c-di-GMP-specific phosphodiesterase class I)